MEQISSDKYIIFLDVDGAVFDGKEVPKRTSDAGIGVAMGNADKRIKSIADFITTDCSSGGVADALNALIFSKNA